MYCKKHEQIPRFCSIIDSNCKQCNSTFTTFNAPPINDICEKCSEKLNICELCGCLVDEKKQE